MKTISWQIRKYVPDSDDDGDEEDLIDNGHEWRNVKADQKEESSQLQTKEDQGQSTSYGTYILNEQENQDARERNEEWHSFQNSPSKPRELSQQTNTPTQRSGLALDNQYADNQATEFWDINHTEEHTDLHNIPSAQANAVSSSISSSPLSSMSSTPLCLSPRLPQQPSEGEAQNLPIHIDIRDISQDLARQEHRPARQLRERKAIQLNPYAIEGQLFKQAWRSRGLVPLQVRNDSQVETNETTQLASSQLGYESQSSDDDKAISNSFGGDEDLQTTTSLSPVNRHLFSPRGIFDTHQEPSARKTPKRRKLAHPDTKRNHPQVESSTPNALHVREDGWIEVPFANDKALPATRAAQQNDANKRLLSRNITNSFAPTMTPVSVHSFSPTSSPILPDPSDLNNRSTAVTGRAIPQQLQTPATSSEAPLSREKKDHTRRVLILSPQKPVSEDENDSIVHVDSTSEGEGDDDQMLRQIIKAQRRTKGVLPASWHRLEYQKLMSGKPSAIQKQHSLSKKHRSSNTSPSKDTRKGVARRIVSTQRRAHLGDSESISQAIIDIESDSEERNMVHMPAKQQQDINDFFPSNEHFDSSDIDDDDDTNMEDNSIDIMNSRSGAAKSHRTHKRRTKQPKIKDYLPAGRVASNEQNLDANGYATFNQTWKNTSIHNKPQKRIVDILDVTDRLTREQTPKFLAYAARTARQRKLPRQSVSMQKRQFSSGVKEARKYQRHLPLDRRKSSARAGHPRPISREPLHERTSNNSRILVHLDGGAVDSDLEGEDGSLQTLPLAIKSRENHHGGVETRSDNVAVPSTSEGKFLVRGYPITSRAGLAHPLGPAHLETIDCNRRRQHTVRRGQKLVLDRFLQRSTSQVISSPTLPLALIPATKTKKQTRKRLPSHIPVAFTTENDQSENYESNHGEISSKETRAEIRPDSSRLPGLLPFGTEYSTTFGTIRLPDGHHFQASTLLGSGIFSDSLKASLGSVSLGAFCSVVEGQAIEWSGWNEVIAQQVFQICDRSIESAISLGQPEFPNCSITDGTENLKSIIQYLSKHLRFIDPVDCTDFVLRWTASIDRYNDQLSTLLLESAPRTQQESSTIDVICHLVTIANQIRQIADFSVVDQQTKSSISKSSARMLRYLIQVTFRSGYKDFILFSRDPLNLSTTTSRAKISQKSEALVIIHYLHQNSSTLTTIWDAVREPGLLLPSIKRTVPALEQVWKNMLSLLPLLELDDKGQAHGHVSALSAANNWKLVKQLIEPVFGAYSNTTQRSTIHQYCRTLYGRCYWLLDYWGWNDCESIMGFLFDFFAQNKLHDLNMEVHLKYTAFLSSLTNTTDLDIRTSDCCFHVLLKLIGKGLRSMRKQYKDKKVSNCIWRLTPNHDRTLPKDESLRQEDLSAVHNHLDLLVVLYWAAPPQYRIRIDLIQKLIDIQTSHKEVCHLVVKTWSNLVSFQLSTQESVDKLDPFIDWYDEIIVKLTRLHQLARNEVESDAKRAEALQGQYFTKDDQERIIQASQRNVQSVLIDALSSLKAAILGTETAEKLQKILPSSLRHVFELWEASRPNLNQVLVQVLDVIQTWAVRAQQLYNTEDSQGFGDWSGIQELISDTAQPASLTVPADLWQALQDFLSAIFGSEYPVEDDLLQSSIHCWLDVAGLDVAADHLMWDDLIDSYAPGSWMTLRDTPQMRRFTPLVLTLLIKKDPKLYESKRLTITQCWIQCLVERESLVKYQPDLTSALLDHGITEPLFQNQPFSKELGTFRISIADFLEQRLSLIACVLSNMRESLSFSTYHQLQDYQGKRKDYSELLRHLMNTMKDNFLSLRQRSNQQGAYVPFTQNVVQLLQEHTADICKVDGFFLDAVNFPLPDEDPEYLVSKLKSLALQLPHNRGWQQLAAFLQSICERAVIEGNQYHFAALIFSATDGIFETSQEDQLTLRSFIFCEILPEYIDAIFNTSCGWIVAETLLISLSMILQKLLFNMDSFSTRSMIAVKSIISRGLSSISDSLAKILGSKSDLGMRTVTTITRYFAIVEASLAISSHVVTRSEELARHPKDVFDHYLDLMTFFTKSALYILRKLEDPGSDIDCPSAPTSRSRIDGLRPIHSEAARKFVRELLYDTLDPASHKCKWRIQGDVLLVHRNARWDPVEFDLKSLKQKQQELSTSAKSLLDKLKTNGSFGRMATKTTARYSHLVEIRRPAVRNEYLFI